ncbi:hypothetical protein LJC74_01130 [Eubacteriales bacterium OttesenSCG-928-A19]|nr:hypothetical protein [Eubacteriales bacterium OttesenSCG-928-A19]
MLITDILNYAAELLDRTSDMQPYSLSDAVAYVQRNGRKGRPLWVEAKDNPNQCGWIPCEGILAYACASPDYFEENTRYWPERPTPEQTAEWPWDDNAPA